MPYEHNLSKPFIAPIFIEEDGYWQNCMKPYLEREGWYIAEVDCAGATGSLDFGRRLLTALDFDWDFFRMSLMSIGLLNMLLRLIGLICVRGCLCIIKILRMFCRWRTV